MRIIPSITLNVEGAYFPSGVAVEVSDEIAQNAISLGLAAVAPEPEIEAEPETAPEPEVEAAIVEAPETATTTRAKRKQ